MISATMPQSVSRVLIHTIFSTKKRKPYFRNRDFRAEVHAFLGGISKRLGCQPICIGGASDHVHLLTRLSRTLTVAAFIREVKRVSSRWIRTRGGIYAQFRWQSGYGVFSVSQSLLEEVVRYIDNQDEHHRKMTFQEELRTLMIRHGVEFDEQFFWD